MPHETPQTFETISPQSNEIIVSCEVLDLSGLEPWFVNQQIEHVLPFAKKIVVFPDLGPTEKGVVPTGSITEINYIEHPNWPELVKGADIGCGMAMAEININKNDFLNHQDMLDQLYSAIKSDPEVSLGGGNHFIDFVSDKDGKVYVVIHTGAYRDRQKGLSRIITQKPSDEDWSITTNKYLEEYTNVIVSANENRLAILKHFQNIYGTGQIHFHEPHNTIAIDDKTQTVTIYKGVVHVTDTNKRLLLPSTMNSRMDFYKPGKKIGPETNWGAPHGTGRNKSRSQMKNLKTIPLDIMTVSGTTPPQTEMPEAYRTITQAETTMLNNDLMIYDEEDDIIELQPIAYIGHI